MNPGGMGQGSHLIIGVERGGGVRWFGFYPNADGERGEGGRSWSPGEGPGRVVINDYPRGDQSNDVSIELTENESKKLRKAIWASRLDYESGYSHGYSLRRFNCANWVVHMLSHAELPRPRKTSGFLTPKQTLQHYGALTE